MKKILLLLFINVLLFSRDIIYFAPLPMENASKTLEIFTPLVNYIESKTGKNIKMIYKGSNKEVMEGLKDGSIDIAYFGPLPYARLSTQFKDVVPIVQYLENNGKETYTCTLFKRKGEALNLKNIVDKQFALTHKYSTCGYAFVYELLRENKSDIDDNYFKYIGSHYNAVFEVITGDYDIGAVKTSIFNKYKHLNIESIAAGKPNPGLMIVANGSTLNKKEIVNLQNIILNITSDEKKEWDPKIKRDVIRPNLELLNQYKQRIKDIKLKDDE